MFSLKRTISTVALAASLSVPLLTAAQQNDKEGESYSPYADIQYPETPLWGDTHLHTALSGDAIAYGVLLSPADAYKLALGQQVTSSHGMDVRLSRPLDFLVVADHAEAYGLVGEIIKGNEYLLSDPTVKKWHEELLEGKNAKVAGEMIAAQSTGNLPPIMLKSGKVIKGAWDQARDTAEQYNQPGKFTALHGFEWTSLVNGNNLHRVVIFKDDQQKVKQISPLDSNVSGMNPEGLWKWMSEYEANTDGEVLAIPHNGNLSNGMMFALTEFEGGAMTEGYAKRRMRWEPLVEMTQIKGDGEAHPLLSPNDEFADFETWDKGNLPGSEAKTEDMLHAEYSREALKNGLALEQKLGSNPYKFGMIGSTDSHTAVPSAEENNFWGKHSSEEPDQNRWVPKVRNENLQGGWQYSSSGLAAVWAGENTRESIFDAMRRKETYATTGPRMTVRMFGGWDFNDSDLKTRQLAKIGYQKGVPMGSDLTNAPKSAAPTFLVAANMDPKGATLDRIQIVKGWLDAKGNTQEKVYDVVWSGDRKINRKGKLPTVGSTVDVEHATWTNSIGAPELMTVWQDPDFDANQRAFYYTRVLEIPTPRWTAYDAKRFDTDMTDDVPMQIQERAYSSPIWYTPAL